MFPIYATAEGLEEALIDRQNEIIDLALAAWGTSVTTHKRIFARYFNDVDLENFPPKLGTFAHAILINLLSNSNTLVNPYHYEYGTRIFEEKFFDKILHCDQDFGLSDAIHSNPARAIHSIVSIGNKIGAYGEIPEDLWLRSVNLISGNEIIRNFDKRPNDTDLNRMFMDGLLKICLYAPKTKNGIEACQNLISELPNIYMGTYLDDLLVSAAESWSDKNLSHSKDVTEFDITSDWDGLRSNERIRFHLWRVGGRFGFDPNHENKDIRLAAYAINSIDENESEFKNYIILSDIENYSKRDGAAFMYANSFNDNIWLFDRESKASEIINKIAFKRGETHPLREEAISENIKKCRKHPLKEVAATNRIVVKVGEDITNELKGYIRDELSERIDSINSDIYKSTRYLINFTFIIFVITAFFISYNSM